MQPLKLLQPMQPLKLMQPMQPVQLLQPMKPMQPLKLLQPMQPSAAPAMHTVHDPQQEQHRAVVLLVKHSASSSPV